MLGQRMIWIGAGDLEDAFADHLDGQRAERYARRRLDLRQVVRTEMAALFDPILDEWIEQGALGFGFGKVRTFDYNAIQPIGTVLHDRELGG